MKEDVEKSNENESVFYSFLEQSLGGPDVSVIRVK